MPNFRVILLALLGMVVGLILWMAYYFYFRTDGHGHTVREADSPEAAARGQRQLARADALLRRGAYIPARALLDSLRDADLDENTFIDSDALRQRYDTLRARQHRAQPVQ